jgi:L,D-transpeptidase ErfK/SrfK
MTPFLPTSLLHTLAGLLLLATNLPALATSYSMPANPTDSLIGDPLANDFFTYASQDDTLLDIARRFDMGQIEILMLNPTVDRWLPGQGTPVRLSNYRLLPDAPRQGLILNLPEYRMYYFPPTKTGTAGIVKTFPHSIGRVDWNTPLGKTTIVDKVKNPTWTPPASIRAEHAAKGDILPPVWPAGPDNPLGLFALRLNIPGYLIHSTNKPFGVGMRVSHGCIRMYPEDIEGLFQEIAIGTSVNIVNQPIKVGWFEDTLYIEVHPTLAETESEDEDSTISEPSEADYQSNLERTHVLIKRANNGNMPPIDNVILKRTLKTRNGYPTAIYKRQTQN